MDRLLFPSSFEASSRRSRTRRSQHRYRLTRVLVSCILAAVLYAFIAPLGGAEAAVREKTQWTPIDPMPTTAQMWGVDATDQMHVWAVGDNGTIVFYDGTGCSIQNSPTSSDLRCVSAVDANHVWAGGAGETICFFNGSRWVKQRGGSIASRIIIDIHAVDPSHVWAVVVTENDFSSSELLFYNGKSWSTQARFDFYLTAISAVSDKEVWAIGNDGAEGVALRYDGTSWNEVRRFTGEDSLEDNFFQVNDVYALDSRHVWIAGSGTYWPEDLLSKSDRHTSPFGPDYVPYELGYFFDGTSWSYGPGGDFIYALDADHVWTLDSFFNGTYWRDDSTGQAIRSMTATDPEHLFAIWRSVYGLVLGQCVPLPDTTTSRAWGTSSVGSTVTSKEWYFAEGSTGPGFETWLSFIDPHAYGGEDVRLTFQTGSGPVTGNPIRFPWYSGQRVTLYLAAEIHNEWGVGIKAKSDVPLAVERTVFGTGRRWATESIGAVAPSSQWYLAEGSTGPGFETWVLLANPGTDDAHAKLTYLTEDGTVEGPSVEVRHGCRATVNVADTLPGKWSVATLVTSDKPLVAERSMFGNAREWAHDSIGASSPSTKWMFAEGSTAGGVETWLTLMNPGDSNASAAVTYITESGPVSGGTVELPARSRKTVNAADAVPGRWDVSSEINSDQPIVAERSMYGNSRHWGTCSIGATSASENWYLSEGCTLPGFETWLIIYNPGPEVAWASCNGTLFNVLTIPARSRLTFNTADLRPGLSEVYFEISSTQPVVVERSMYGDPNFP